jgi:16S rRNA (adenine1518-N6/adenine1519-N6)-dimethyltransferase
LNRKPKLGQNFLVDPAASIAIADSLGDVSRQTVVEIGPGAGAITEILACRAQRLIAIELDHDLASHLHAQLPAVEVVEADILTIDFNTLQSDRDKLKVVGNIPFYISSPILLHLFRYSDVIANAVIMLQKEVADRVIASPGSRDYGLLSATAQMYASIERILTLPPAAFMPPPQVHSTVLRLTMRPRFTELGVAPDTFLPFLRQLFAQKRKTLGKNLRAAGFQPAQIAEALAQSSIPSTARAEELSVERMAALWKALQPG